MSPQDIPELPAPDAPVRDGIGEDDHAIPLWFNVGFYGLIAVGIVYALYYNLSGWSQLSQYEGELAAAAARFEEAREEVAGANPYRGDAAAVAEGKEIFATTCVACHLADGTGLVGPSLVDPYWKYGDDDASRFTSVSEGRPLGMPPWGSQLGPERIWKVLAYVDTLPTNDAPGVGAPDYQPPAAGGP